MDDEMMEQIGQSENTDGESKQPTIDELMERVAKAESLAKKLTTDNKKLTTDNEKLKNSNDVMSAQIAERKREDRASKSEIEQKLEELEEKNKVLEENNRILAEETSRSKAISAYKGLSEDIIEELIEAAGLDADHSSIAQIIEREKKKAVANADAEWQKSRGGANAGAGNSGDGKSNPEKLFEQYHKGSTSSNSDILSHYMNK